MIGMYANQNKGQIPIGFSSDSPASGAANGVWYSNNYYLARWSGTQPSIRYVGLGLLVASNIMSSSPEEGQVFYCPSTNDNGPHAFKDPGQPNPYIDDMLNGNAPATGKCRAGYGCRASDPTRDNVPVNQRGVCWMSGTVESTPSDPYWPVNGWTDLATKVPMMNQARMKTRAIVTDVCANTRIKLAHVTGLNVLLADGSAKFVDQAYWGLNPVDGVTPLLKSLTVNTSSTPNSTMDVYWQRADDAP
jgi:hypothetical protein